ncbi:MAG TPA: SdpI family protein [Bacteroidia bacterium]|nr:SdpI family protein [Bacteroidia bacterium]
MKVSYKSDWTYWILILIPFSYLAFIWSDLPERVVMHFNIDGEPDKWGNKTNLVLVPVLLPLISYLVMLFIPVLDPRKKIEQMGNKYRQLMFIIVLFTSALACFIIYTASRGAELNTHIIFGLLGLLFMFMGYFFQTIKPNYFIGIRTPWTLESEEVWVATHRWSGKIWIAGGLLMVAAAFVTKEKIALAAFAGVVVLLSMVPLVYSFIKFKELEKSGH